MLGLLRGLGGLTMAYTLPHILIGAVLLTILVGLAWRLEPVWIFTAAVMLSVFAGNWQHIGVPGAFAPDRWLLVLGVAALVFRTPGSANRARIRPEFVHGLLVVVTLYAVISAAVVGTLTVKASAFQLLDDLGILPFTVFLVAPVVFPGVRERRILMGGIVILGGYLGLTALFETIGLHSLVLPSYINDPNLGIHYGRARGPFLEAVSNGVALYACAVVATLGLFSFRRGWARLVAGLVIVLCTVGVLFTLQRSVWVASVIASLGALVLLPRLRRWAIPAIGLTVLAIAIPLVVVPGLARRVEGRARQTQTVWDRQNQARAALNMIDQRPLLGFGWAEFQPLSINYYQQAATYPLTGFGLDVHDVYLRYAAELGLIGVTLWAAGILLAAFGALVRRGPPEFQVWKAAAGTLTLFYLIVAAFVPAQTFPNLVLWLLLGVAWTPARPLRVPVAPSRLRWPGRRPARAVSPQPT